MILRTNRVSLWPTANVAGSKMPDQVENSAFGVVHKRLVPLNPHQTAIKVATKQARMGKMKVSDAQISADWAQKQMDRATVRKSEVRKSTRKQRYDRRAATGTAVGGLAGAGAFGGYHARRAYKAGHKDLKRWHDVGEQWADLRHERAYRARVFDWEESGRPQRVWQPGTTGEEFKTPKQAERVRRLRDLANHPSSKGTPEAKLAESKLRNMGFDATPKNATPGSWRMQSVPKGPRPVFVPREKVPFKKPGAFKAITHGLDITGRWGRMGAHTAFGAMAGTTLGGYAALRYHQKREGIGPYRKKKQ